MDAPRYTSSAATSCVTLERTSERRPTATDALNPKPEKLSDSMDALEGERHPRDCPVGDCASGSLVPSGLLLLGFRV